MEPLVVLADFDHWFRQMPMRLPGISPLQFEKLRETIVGCLREVADVRIIDLHQIRSLTSRQFAGDEYVLTLDGGTYFHTPDYSFAMTRAVTRVDDAARGKMIRVAREGFGQFWTQVAVLRREYEASSKRAIVVCDDGIDTGRSLAEVVQRLNEQFLEVSRIVVLLNTNGRSEIEGVPVTALLPDQNVLWTHERDLYWGSPAGGVSLITRDNINRLGGIPYTLSLNLFAKRIGLPENGLDQARLGLLEANRDFWSMLSRAAGRPLRLRDSKRLIWAAEYFSEFDDRSLIATVIEKLMQDAEQ
jgi:hypothetical protein